MKKLLLASLLFCPLIVSAQQPTLPTGVKIWSKGMPPEGIKHKDDYGTHILSVSHRESDGVVELHEHKDDVMVVQSGEATLVVGGKGVGMHTSAPGEQQGTSLEGGTAVPVAAGDVIHIPQGIPHQFFVAPGAQITYTLVKIVNR
jgi:mannose-6-phosphate isomerase-like protein (cupin superfamily)